MPLDPTSKENLTKLADAIVPLADWMAEPTKFVPAEHLGNPLSWRVSGKPLNAENLKVIPFFERLLADDAPDAALETRWHELEADALAHCPIAKMAKWRAERGLESTPEFGAADSDNVVNFHEDAGAHRKLTRSRASFYEEFFKPFDETVKAKGAALNSASAWKAFAVALLADKDPDWPKTAPKSSEFIKTFSRDILIALMGMKNPVGEKDPRWDAAVLIELGEHRRPGNAYTVGQANAATEVFKIKLRAVAAAKAPKL